MILKHSRLNITKLLIIGFVLIFSSTTSYTQVDSLSIQTSQGVPVIFSGDTLFFIYGKLGPFTPQQRALGISQRLDNIVENKIKFDSIQIVSTNELTNLVIDTITLMALTDEDAIPSGRSRSDLAQEYTSIIKRKLAETVERISLRTILINIGLTILYLALASFIFWGMTKIFPKVYDKLESWESTKIPTIKFRKYELLKAKHLTGFLIIIFKGIRLAISLGIIYFLIIHIVSVLPWTYKWDVRPILRGIFFTIITTAAAYVIFKGSNAFFRTLVTKVQSWKGKIIKPIKIKTVEVLSEDRIADLVEGFLKVFRFVVNIFIAYFYITIVFSFFKFTQTWAQTLIGYILKPLGKVLLSFVSFLPNLFFIVVIVFVTRYLIQFIKLIFVEIGKGTIALPGFYKEWADPTFKIVRFLIIVFAVIVIFPYLPGSDSPFFQGISVFIGVLFSLGSTSAIANIVAGVVLTYMRPFNIGDRVKIADTFGDVIEKTLLVTRVRTIKNVDITIPNAMVLGSHIVNFSSSAQDRGLILHTSVTISYDVPWKKVHELLISAADSNQNILKEPKPFVLQTSLDDSYVSYELNAYTDKPNIMATIYSELHESIQDKFNEAGVEIMSPHYSAVRDGNKIAVPENYLPKTYNAPSFRILPLGDLFKKPEGKDRQ